MRLFFVAVAVIVTLGLAGCGKEGPAGPIGPQGPIGHNGSGYSEIVIQPARDNWIGPTSPNSGSLAQISFGYSQGHAVRSLVYFNVAGSGVPVTATVVDAVLTLYPSGGEGAGSILTCHLYPLAKDWTELESTWTAATGSTSWAGGSDYLSTAPIGVFTMDPGSTAPITVHLDESLVSGWLKGQYNYGFVIISDTESGSDVDVAAWSRDYTTDLSKRPALKIIFK